MTQAQILSLLDRTTSTSAGSENWRGVFQKDLLFLRSQDICTFPKGDKETPKMTKNKFFPVKTQRPWFRAKFNVIKKKEKSSYGTFLHTVFQTVLPTANSHAQ